MYGIVGFPVGGDSAAGGQPQIDELM